MSHTIVIAEAGVNHNGSIKLAKELIDVAFEAGADYVKFQTFKAENLVSQKASMAQYQQENLKDFNQSQFQMIKKLEIDKSAHIELIEHCSKVGIKFLSTPFDLDSVDFLSELNLDYLKISSGDINNRPLLEKAAHCHIPIILSTGMSNLEEVQEALAVLYSNGCQKENITVLHCNTEYPTPYDDVNLRAMTTMKQELGVSIGYSDHTSGIEVAIGAVAMGAEIIEKHFTLNKLLEGPDHKASLEPNELKQMITSIRNIEKSLGSGVKQPSNSELKNIPIARRSIHLRRDLLRGAIIAQSDLIMKRPGNGLSPMLINNVIGKTVLRDLPRDHLISEDDLA